MKCAYRIPSPRPQEQSRARKRGSLWCEHHMAQEQLHQAKADALVPGAAPLSPILARRKKCGTEGFPLDDQARA